MLLMFVFYDMIDRFVFRVLNKIIHYLSRLKDFEKLQDPV